MYIFRKMGQIASVVKAFNCEACAKFVCNAMDVKSQCGDCFSCEFVTER